MTRTHTQEPEAVHEGPAGIEEDEVSQPDGVARPHPDDWPEDISEPEFLELTQVYSGDEQRGQEPLPESVEPSPEQPVPGDEMQPYYIADESPDEVIFAPALTRDEPVHEPQDFIAEEPSANYTTHETNAPEADLAEAEILEPMQVSEPATGGYAPVAGQDEPDVQVHPARTQPEALADATPTLEDFEQAYPAEKARQGRIVLDKPEKRALFLGGFVGMVIVALAMFLMETV